MGRFSRTILSPLIFLMVLWPTSLLAQYRLQDSGIPIIERLTESYKGQTLSLATLDQIVKEISQDGLFQVVYVEQLDSDKVVIRAQQSIKLKEIQISGNTSYNKQELMETMGIKTGQVLSNLEVVQAIDKIKNVYQGSGFYNFNLTYGKELTNEGMILKIDISESDFCIIEDIQVFSKNNYLNKRMKEFIPEFLNTNYQKESSDVIEKRLNELLLKNRFLTAKVKNTSTVFNQNKTRVKLKFTVSNAVQYEFVFHGNEFFSHFDLIKESEIGSKFLYLSDSSSEIEETVIDLYLQNGFPHVEVKSSQRYFEESKKRVFVFEINEGSRIRIGNVEVVGKISRNKSFYIDLFNEYLAEEAHSVFYVQKDIEHAAEEMVTHLKRQGHLMAELLSVNAEFSQQQTANVTVQIDEGILTYVRQILFRGSKSFSNIELKERVKIVPNKPLNLTEVESSFDLLESFYRKRGYLEFKILNRNAAVIQYKKGQPYADLVYQVKEGPKIQVKSIRVSGNKKTKTYVVMRELDFKEGDLLTLERLTNSLDRLEKTGLFGKVNIRSLEQDSPNGDRTIVVEVEDRKPGLFSSGVGVFNEGLLGVRGYVGALYNNLWGKARGISSRVDLRYEDRVFYVQNRIALAYYEPYLTENRLRGRVSVVREQQRLSFIDNEAIIRSSNELRLSTEKEFSKHLRFTYNVWAFINQESFFANDSNRQSDQVVTQNIGLTGPVLELDYRNDQFLPTKGWYTRFDLEYSDPVIGSSRDNPGVEGTATSDISGLQVPADARNEINYYRATFSTTKYTPLTKSKRWVWVNSLRGGYLRNVSSREDSGVPQVRSFFLGGSSTIRGFSFGTSETVPGQRELCIRQNLINSGQETKECRIDNIYVRDDSAYVLFKSELRFPISGAFGGAIFYDGGAVVHGDFGLEDPYRDSIGFGFTYDTPVGSFVIGVGYKLDRKTASTYYDDESEVAFHLAIGTF